ncbi:STAS domain-containing protein [Cloacibacillus sp.]
MAYITGVVFFSNDDKLVKSFRDLPHCDKVIISLRGVPLIDFVGATTLIGIIGERQRAGTTVLLCGVHPKVMQTLERCNIYEALPREYIRASVDTALFGED